MDLRGTVSASTAASVSAPLVAHGISGTDRPLPAMFPVIVGTVTNHGLRARPRTPERSGLAKPKSDLDAPPRKL